MNYWSTSVLAHAAKVSVHDLKPFAAVLHHSRAGQKMHGMPCFLKTSIPRSSESLATLRLSWYSSQFVLDFGISAQCLYTPPSLIITALTLLGQNAATYSTDGSADSLSQTSIWRGGLKATFSSLLNSVSSIPLYIILFPYIQRSPTL